MTALSARIPYKTAKEHFEALLAQAKAHGGTTVYTKAATSDWDGCYSRDPIGTDSPGFIGLDHQAAAINHAPIPSMQPPALRTNPSNRRRFNAAIRSDSQPASDWSSVKVLVFDRDELGMLLRESISIIAKMSIDHEEIGGQTKGGNI